MDLASNQAQPLATSHIEPPTLLQLSLYTLSSSLGFLLEYTKLIPQQGLYTCFSLSLECPSSRCLHALLPPSIQASAQMFPPQRGLP